MTAQSQAGGTDLGRRIREQREQSGLSREQAADRAGLNERYLSYLEDSAAAAPSKATLTRLAAALETTAGALSGEGMNIPPGSRGAGARPVLRDLSHDECQALIAAGGVGRLLFDQEGRGPVAMPGNYRMDGEDVVFRTESDGAVAAGIRGGTVSFDVDHLDDALAEGWSVLLTGTASVISDPAEQERVAGLAIEPWAGGERLTYVRLRPSQVTGRAIRARGLA
jgi:transcriptional regulator with XRE-family HTH domain